MATDMKFKMLALAAVALLCTLSCSKTEPVIPDGQKEKIEGRFVKVDGSQLANEYLTFDNEKMCVFRSGTDHAFVDNALWHCEESDFKQKRASKYFIHEGMLYVEDQPFDRIRVDGDDMVFGNAEYKALKDFHKEYYSEILVEDTNVSLDATAKVVSFTVKVKNPLPSQKVTAKCDAVWVSNLSVEGETLSFRITSNSTGRDRTAFIDLTYVAAEDVCCIVTQTGQVD